MLLSRMQDVQSVVCVVGTAVPDELWTYSVLVRTLVRIIIAGVTALLGTPGRLTPVTSTLHAPACECRARAMSLSVL